MKDNLLSISELAYFSRISRDTLIYYDKIGLIKPTLRTENNYRYYSSDNIGIANMIRTFQSFGFTLEAIKELLPQRSPHMLLEIQETIMENISREIAEMETTRALMLTLKTMVEEALATDEQAVKYRYQQAESILLGPQVDYSDGKSDYDALIQFYEYCKQHSPTMNLNWSAWGYFDGQRIARGDWRYPDRFYFNRPDSSDVKPAGYYVVGYCRGNYGQTDELYRRLLAYIQAHHLNIVGGAYEAYVLNEIVVVDPAEYLIQVSIEVNERDDLKDSDGA